MLENGGGRGALAADVRRRRPGGEDRWGRRLEGYGKMVNLLEGFTEEGAHHMELSKGA
jgi:hypothetical protein